MRAPVARIIIALALVWVSARGIWWELRTPREPILDVSVLCMVISGTVIAASMLLLTHSSVRLWEAVRSGASGNTPARPELAGPVMRAGVLIAVPWIVAGVIVWGYLGTPPYARLVPEPSSVIPVGETVTYIAETDLPDGMTVHAERAYRPEGECRSGRERIGADDGQRVRIEACHDGIGVIRVRGVGVANDYTLGAPNGGREVAYAELLFWDYDSPATPGRDWYLVLGGATVAFEAVDWQSGQIMMPFTLGFLPEFPPLEGYFVDIFDLQGKRLVRLDLANAHRIEASTAPARTIERLDLRESVLNETFIFQWGPCAKPWGRVGSIGVSFVEKSSPSKPVFAPVC